MHPLFAGGFYLSNIVLDRSMACFWVYHADYGPKRVGCWAAFRSIERNTENAKSQRHLASDKHLQGGRSGCHLLPRQLVRLFDRQFEIRKHLIGWTNDVQSRRRNPRRSPAGFYQPIMRHIDVLSCPFVANCDRSPCRADAFAELFQGGAHFRLCWQLSRRVRERLSGDSLKSRQDVLRYVALPKPLSLLLGQIIVLRIVRLPPCFGLRTGHSSCPPPRFFDLRGLARHRRRNCAADSIGRGTNRVVR